MAPYLYFHNLLCTLCLHQYHLSLVQTGDKRACRVVMFIHSSSLSQVRQAGCPVPNLRQAKVLLLVANWRQEKVVVLSFAISAGKKKTETIE